MDSIVKRSVVLAGHKTSVSLEDQFWNALKDIAKARGKTLSETIVAIDGERTSANCRQRCACSSSIIIRSDRETSVLRSHQAISQIVYLIDGLTRDY